jgi:catechol 2,3-dioxygenase-like lactoylglutathione lyase family enzyme
MSAGRCLGAVTLLVRDYHAAIAWFRDSLGFELLADTDLGGGKRWVLVAPRAGGTPLLLAQASDDAQRARIGDQAGGRVAFFLHTDDFARDHARMTAAGVTFREEPRQEAYGSVAVFEDLCGNLWDLIEPKNG